MPTKTRKPQITSRVNKYLSEHRSRPLSSSRRSRSSDDSLYSELLGIGSSLSNPQPGDDRKKLRKRASWLTRLINVALRKSLEVQGKKYQEQIGRPIDQHDIKRADEHAKYIESTYITPVRRPKQSEPIKRPQFELDLLKEDLTKGQWYATDQVSALTNKPVPAGGSQLTSFIKNSKHERPLTFSYLKTPDKNDSSLNHFVSIHVDQARNEITYIDPVGDKISDEDKLRLQKTFPDAKICYLDETGKKIDSKTADKFPENILRVQYDGHNCGMYSTELTKLMINANENEAKRAKEIDRIKKMNPNKQRQNHTEGLKMVYQQVIEPTQTPLLAKPRKPRGR